MEIRLIVLNNETGNGAIEARDGTSTALIDFFIEDNGSITKGWTKYTTKARDLASFPAAVKEIDVEKTVKTFPDYWVYTKLPVTL